MKLLRATDFWVALPPGTLVQFPWTRGSVQNGKVAPPHRNIQSALQAQFKQTDNRIHELKKAYDMVQKIIKPQQEKPQRTIKKEREER